MRFFNQKPRRHPVIQNLPFRESAKVNPHPTFTRGKENVGRTVEIDEVERSAVGKYPTAFIVRATDTGEKFYIPLANEQRMLQQLRDRVTLAEANNPIGVELAMTEEIAPAGYVIYLWKPLGFRKDDDHDKS